MIIPILMLALGSAVSLADSPVAKVEKEVLAAMDSWKQAMIARDRVVLDRIYAPDLIYTHSNGRQESKTEAIESVVNGKDRIEAIEMAHTSVKVYGKTGLVKSKINLRLMSDGKSNTLNLDVLHVWIKISSRWWMVARQATRLNP